MRVLLPSTLSILAHLAAAQTWTSVGPTPLSYAPFSNPFNFNSGRVSSIAVDPGNSNHWLVGAGNGGVWETRDAGATFIPLSDAWPTLAVGAIAFAPSDATTIYVGTGESSAGFEHSGLGMMKSTNGGQTWTLLAASSFARGSVKRIRVHPANPNVVLATVSRGGYGRDSQDGVPAPPPFGVLKSTDGGSTWTRILGGQATALEIDPTNFNNQYAAIGDRYASLGVTGFPNDPPGSVPNGVYRSTDGGAVWTLVPGPWGASTLLAATTGRIELAIAPSNPSTVYASIQIPPSGALSTGLLGLYRTDNAWAPTPTWIQIPTAATGAGGYCGIGKCGYSHVISVDPSDPNTLFAGGGDHPRVFRCSDCGPSPVWTNLVANSGVHPDFHALSWAGNRLIAGNDGGVWSTTDRGKTWNSHNATLSTAMFFSAALHPADPNFILGGLRDFQISLRRDSNTWLVFSPISPNREWGEAEVAVSSSRPDTDWMAAWCCDGSINRTTDGGKTGIPADAGIDKTDVAFVAPVRKCPSNDDVFLTGTNRVWRTNNFFTAATPEWVANGPVLNGQNGGGSTFPNSPATILEIEFAPSDSTCNTYAIGNRRAQLQMTRDGGKTWTNLDPGRALPPRPVNGLAFDPTNPNILYAALSSFDEATPGQPGHVFKTSNALAASPAWVNVGPQTNQPFNVIRVDPVNPKLIYAGSDTGLWRSTDGAATWVHDGPQSGLPNAASIYDIKINPATGRTVVFTYGRGAFVLGQSLPPAASSAEPASGGGPSQTFTFKFRDPRGWQDLDVVNVLINNFLDGRKACYLAYSVPGNTLYLVGNDGATLLALPALGGDGSVNNSQCTISAAASSATGSGDTLTLTVTLRFEPGFGGNKLLYMAARDQQSGNSGWQALGTWQVLPFTTAGTVSIVSLTPARAIAGPGAAQILTAVVADSKGSGDIGVVNLLINNFIDGRQGCYLAYVPSSNSILLVNDSGDAGGPFAGSIIMNGSPTTIQNSQCLVDGTGTSAVKTGNSLTLTLKIIPKSSLTGNRVIWMAGRDAVDGNNTDWQAVGAWTIQ